MTKTSTLRALLVGALLVFTLPLAAQRKGEAARFLETARQNLSADALRSRAFPNVVTTKTNANDFQDPKVLTNLPADSAIFMQNFIPASAGDTIAFCTVYDTDLVRYFLGNTIKEVQTLLPDSAESVSLFILDPYEQDKILYLKRYDSYKGNEPETFECDFTIDSVRPLLVGFNLVFKEETQIQAAIVPCNRNGSFLLFDSQVGQPGFLDYTYMRYMLYGDPHPCYGYMINCRTEGEGGFPEYDIALDDVTHTRSFLGETSASFGIGITNYGTAAFPKAKLRCTLGDAVKDVEFNKPLGFLYYGYIESDLPLPTEAMRVPLSVQLLEVNGQDVTMDNNPETGSITVVDPALTENRRPVMEEFTGGWCGWCPRGSRAIELLLKEYDEFIPIAIHSNDALEAADFLPIISNYASGGFPGFTMNRLVNGDPFYGSNEYGGGSMGVKKDIAHIQELPCEAKLTITSVSLSDDRTSLTVQTDTKFTLKSATAPYRLAYVLTEDSLQVAQSNYYSTAYGGSESDTPQELRDLVNMPGKYWAICNDVARFTTGLDGIEGSIAAPIEANRTQQYTYTLDVPANIEQLAYCHLIVLLLDTATGEILNADRTSLAAVSAIHEAPTAQGVATVGVKAGQLSVSAAAGEVSVFDAAGREVAKRRVDGSLSLPLGAGCYVVRVQTASGVQTAKVTL